MRTLTSDFVACLLLFQDSFSSAHLSPAGHHEHLSLQTLDTTEHKPGLDHPAHHIVKLFSDQGIHGGDKT